MKLYVDELPKSCSVCSCGVEDEMCCCWCMAFEDGFNRYICSEDFETKRLSSCPLQSLADHYKQVRKEVCEEIKKKAELFGVCKTGIIKEEYRIDKEVLDQIQD